MSIDSRNQCQSDECFDKISNLMALVGSNNNSKNETDLNIIKLETGSEDKVSNAKHCKNIERYKVQLGSVKSQAEAIKEGDRIKKQFPKILKNVVITTKKVKYDDRIAKIAKQDSKVYRIATENDLRVFK